MKKKESEPTNRIGTAVPIQRNRIGTRISEAAKEVGGVGELARMAGISESQLYRYINGTSSPTLEPLAAIARGAGVSLDWLVEDIGTKKRPAPQPTRLSDAQVTLLRIFKDYKFGPEGSSDLSLALSGFVRAWNAKAFGPGRNRIDNEAITHELRDEIGDISIEDIRRLGKMAEDFARFEREEKTKQEWDGKRIDAAAAAVNVNNADKKNQESPSFEADLMRQIIEGVEMGLDEAGLMQPPEGKAQFILKLYEWFVKARPENPRQEVIDLFTKGHRDAIHRRKDPGDAPDDEGNKPKR